MADTGLKFIPHMNTKSCCCNCSSKTGCLITGYLGAIGILLNFIIHGGQILLSEDSNKCILILFSGTWMAAFCIHYVLIEGFEKQEPIRMYSWIYLAYTEVIIHATITALCIILLLALLILGKSVEYGLGFISLFLIVAIFAGLFYGFSSFVTHRQDLGLIRSGQQILTP